LILKPLQFAGAFFVLKNLGKSYFALSAETFPEPVLSLVEVHVLSMTEVPVLSLVEVLVLSMTEVPVLSLVEV
jgi:hypothetical protein